MLKDALKDAEKNFPGTVHFLGDERWSVSPVLSTGALALDIALGGGWAKGYINQIYGKEACGKSTLALHAVKEFQDTDTRNFVYIDTENGFDPKYAKGIGLDIDRCLFYQPTHGDEAFDFMDRCFEKSSIYNVGLIVIDSVTGLVPKEILAADSVEDKRIGLLGRLMSTGISRIKRFTGNVESACTFLFVNQVRSNIGVYYGPSETPTGGYALKFYSHATVKLARVETLKAMGQDPEGIRVKATVEKNKHAPPYRTSDIDIYFGKGIDQVGSLVDVAIEKNVVLKSGAWLTYLDLRWQGRSALIHSLREDTELNKKLLQGVLEKCI